MDTKGDNRERNAHTEEKAQGEGGHLNTKREASEEIKPGDTLILDF